MRRREAIRVLRPILRLLPLTLTPRPRLSTERQVWLSAESIVHVVDID